VLTAVEEQENTTRARLREANYLPKNQPAPEYRRFYRVRGDFHGPNVVAEKALDGAVWNLPHWDVSKPPDLRAAVSLDQEEFV
jgi:hypothetical protein